MSVEANAPMNDSATIEHNNPINDPAASAAADDALGAVWDRMERDNGSSRDDGGKFASSATQDQSEGQDGQGSKEPLEGGEGGEPQGGEISTPSPEVPLPSNWRGLEDTWSKIPAELRESIAAHEGKLHQTLSQQGQALAAFKPIGDVINEYKDYFGGERGDYKPADAIQFMFNLQRQMDDKPFETLIEIADRYNLRPVLAQAFGGQQPQPNEAALLQKISQLEQVIRESADPSKFDERITQRLKADREEADSMDVVSRLTKDMPLFADVDSDEMATFISKSWKRLGETASKDDVLRLAYDMAINADPDLRQKAAALKSAATADPKQIADAKRANATNIRSTTTGKPREATEEELLGAVFDKHKRA